MSKLKDYVKGNFHEVNEKDWTKAEVIEFINSASNLDSDVYESIIDIDYDDLIHNIAGFDSLYVEREVISIQVSMYINAKEQINELLGEIEEDIETEGMDEYQLNGFASEADYNNWRHG